MHKSMRCKWAACVGIVLDHIFQDIHRFFVLLTAQPKHSAVVIVLIQNNKEKNVFYPSDAMISSERPMHRSGRTQTLFHFHNCIAASKTECSQNKPTSYFNGATSTRPTSSLGGSFNPASITPLMTTASQNQRLFRPSVVLYSLLSTPSSTLFSTLFSILRYSTLYSFLLLSTLNQ